jgi:hypothetical protein
LRGPCPDRRDERGRVQPRRDAEKHGFGRRDIVDGDEVIGDQLHPRRVAEPAKVDHFARNRFQERAHDGQHRGIAARVDHRIARRHLGTGAADRAIEQRDAAGREDLRHALLVSQAKRARIDHEVALPRLRDRSGNFLCDAGRCQA